VAGIKNSQLSKSVSHFLNIVCPKGNAPKIMAIGAAILSTPTTPGWIKNKKDKTSNNSTIQISAINTRIDTIILPNAKPTPATAVPAAPTVPSPALITPIIIDTIKSTKPPRASPTASPAESLNAVASAWLNIITPLMAKRLKFAIIMAPIRLGIIFLTAYVLRPMERIFEKAIMISAITATISTKLRAAFHPLSTQLDKTSPLLADHFAMDSSTELTAPPKTFWSHLPAETPISQITNFTGSDAIDPGHSSVAPVASSSVVVAVSRVGSPISVDDFFSPI